MKQLQRNQAVRALRKIIGLTQAEFAVIMGVSKDAVVSWEIGRNELSATYARRIALVTGVDELATHRLNHRSLRSLGHRTPCQVYHDPARRLRLHGLSRQRIFRDVFEQNGKRKPLPFEAGASVARSSFVYDLKTGGTRFAVGCLFTSYCNLFGLTPFWSSK